MKPFYQMDILLFLHGVSFPGESRNLSQKNRYRYSQLLKLERLGTRLAADLPSGSQQRRRIVRITLELLPSEFVATG